MKQCKPCVTIRDILVILKNNAVQFYYNTKTDIKSYRNINATACEFDNKPCRADDLVLPEVRKIREKARENYKGVV